MSAFSFYSKKKKNDDKQLTSSTPLPETSSLFPGLPVSPSVSNVFLGSPIEKPAGITKKKGPLEALASPSKISEISTNKKKDKMRSKSALKISLDSLSNGKSPIDKKHRKKENKKRTKSEGTENEDQDSDAKIPSPVKTFIPEIGNKKERKNVIKNGKMIDLDSQGSDAGVFVAPKKKKLKLKLTSEKSLSPSKANSVDGIDMATYVVGKKRKADKEDKKPTIDVLDLDTEDLKNARGTQISSPKPPRAKKFKSCEEVKTKQKKEKTENSAVKGQELLAWIISPITIEDFFENYWEKKPLHIARNNVEYFDGICSKADLDTAFRKCPVNLLKNVTITAYENGERTTETTPGRARPNAVWDMYDKGHSIRILNPQTFVPNVGTMVATLQEYFRCMVGVNSYLTPAGTQGFAPHYDDIEAFVLQMEGEKEWKVYPPLSEDETLPQFSSRDFNQDEIGEPILEVTLKAGDLLYFPRGWIHQARSVQDHHSLHLTVSTYQCNTWGDYFKTVLPAALDNAIASDVEFRSGLPLDFIDYMGVGMIPRQAILDKATHLFSKLVNHCPWGEAADQLGKEFIHSSFPPPHEDLEENVWKTLLDEPMKTSIRLIAANVTRICSEEDDKLVCYYSTDNSIEPKGEELMGFEISSSEANVIQLLREEYPKYTKCHRLVSEEVSEDQLSELLYALGQRALLNVKFLK